MSKEMILNAGMATLLADPEYVEILAALPAETTFYDVCEQMSDDSITPTQKALCTRQMIAFWNAHGNLAQSFKGQAEDWRKIVEGLRAELDGLHPE